VIFPSTHPPKINTTTAKMAAINKPPAIVSPIVASNSALSVPEFVKIALRYLLKVPISIEIFGSGSMGVSPMHSSRQKTWTGRPRYP
jgi:hypothetical protein